jgi:UDP-N-acetylmuramate--alanine ligase
MRHVFFIGIGGAGTSALAELLLMQGTRVSGSDLVASEKTEALIALGAKICIGHAATNIAEDVDLVVYSSAVHSENAEYEEANRRGVRMLRRANFMAELLHDNRVIAVAGTHGKTTTSSMIASMLIEAKLDPTALIGAQVKELGGHNARNGRGALAVVEADEYDRSFLTLRPYIAVMTSLEAEHLDIYRDLADLQTAFVQFANQGESSGFAIVCIDDPGLRVLTPQLQKRIVAYGIESQDAKYRAIDIVQTGTRTKATILRGGQHLGDLELNVPGQHNVKNALATIATGEILSIPFETTRKALKKFAGALRRFQIVGDVGGILVIDDYAHHPTELRATLAAVKAGYPGRRIIVSFQPHTFTRTRDFAEEFGKALVEFADEIYLLDVYPAREEPIDGVTSDLIVQAARQAATTTVVPVSTVEELPSLILERLRPGDVVLTIGAGNITLAAPQIVQLLEQASSKQTVAA